MFHLDSILGLFWSGLFLMICIGAVTFWFVFPFVLVVFLLVKKTRDDRIRIRSRVKLLYKYSYRWDCKTWIIVGVHRRTKQLIFEDPDGNRAAIGISWPRLKETDKKTQEHYRSLYGSDGVRSFKRG